MSVQISIYELSLQFEVNWLSIDNIKMCVNLSELLVDKLST